MAKKVTGYVKLQIPAGKATPAPPVGPALGQHGINIAQFVKEFNERTANKVATVTWEDCLKIAQIKMPDVNAADVEACARMVAGTARSMGIVVKKD